jgi:hypothetical protein
MRYPGRWSIEYLPPVVSPLPVVRPKPGRLDPMVVSSRHLQALCPSGLCSFPSIDRAERSQGDMWTLPGFARALDRDKEQSEPRVPRVVQPGSLALPVGWKEQAIAVALRPNKQGRQKE